MKCLVTGIDGFVGAYLANYLSEKHSNIYGITLNPNIKSNNENFLCDLRDFDKINEIILNIKPDTVYHLAAQPFVPIAIANPQETLDINVKGTLNLLESLKNSNKSVKFIYISSSDIYGNQDILNLPIRETCIPAPLNPYSISKLAAENYALGYSRFAPNLSIMIARPFNHIGIGQREEFVVPNFFKQIFQIQKEGGSFIKVGDLNSSRDFLDVRDVVKAYYYLDEKGIPGEIYNICSGYEIKIQVILENILNICKANIKIQIDPQRVRSVEAVRLFGSNEKIKNLGWQQEITLNQSLLDIYNSLQ